MEIARKIKDRIKYITLERLWNQVKIKQEIFLRHDRVNSFPNFLIVEPCNVCNLRCPLCPTGQNLPASRGTMTMETYTRLIDQLHRYVHYLNLFYLGEPLLCRDLPQMIKYAREHKIKVSVSSNLNIFSEKMAEQLIDSQMDHLIVSLDGTIPETYAKYRIGGDYNTVVKHIKLLAEKKKEMKSSYPRILIQFVIFKHNEEEIPKAKELAKSLGVDIFFRQGALGGKGQSPPLTKDTELAKKWLTQNKRYQFEYDYFSDKPYLRGGVCGYLWKVATINWDGSVLPCCWVYDNKNSFGNIMEQDFKNIWNNSYFRSSRNLFSRKSKGWYSESNKWETICCQCKMYKHHLNRC